MWYEGRNQWCEATLRSRVHRQLRIRWMLKELTLWLKLTEWHFLDAKCLQEVKWVWPPLRGAWKHHSCCSACVDKKPARLVGWSVQGKACLHANYSLNHKVNAYEGHYRAMSQLRTWPDWFIPNKVGIILCPSFCRCQSSDLHCSSKRSIFHLRWPSGCAERTMTWRKYWHRTSLKFQTQPRKEHFMVSRWVVWLRLDWEWKYDSSYKIDDNHGC